MEGNFRIVQESEYIFVIQKEVTETVTKGRWPFRTTHKNSYWADVNKKGNTVYWGNEREIYLSLDQATLGLNNIIKYPIVIEYTSIISKS